MGKGTFVSSLQRGGQKKAYFIIFEIYLIEQYDYFRLIE